MDTKLAEARKQAEHPLDPVTGQPFYQPKIGRPPSYQRNHADLPIGEYLYGMRWVPVPETWLDLWDPCGEIWDLGPGNLRPSVGT